MVDEAVRQQRRSDGLCIRCGAERTGVGVTLTLCAGCADRARAAHREYEQTHPERRHRHDSQKVRVRAAVRTERYRSAGRCTVCGHEREAGSSYLLCATCRANRRKRGQAYRQRVRETKPWAELFPVPLPRYPRQINVERLGVYLDGPCGAIVGFLGIILLPCVPSGRYSSLGYNDR